jgi:hypothetical protein
MRSSFLFLVLVALSSSTLFAQALPKRILLEEFSTAPCGFCPDGDIVAEKLVKDHPQVIWVTHHAGFGTDSLTIPASSTIAHDFTNFAPGGVLNRGDYPIPIYTNPPYIAVSRQRWDSVVTAHAADPAVATVTVIPTYKAATRTLDCQVDVLFYSVPAEGDLRVNVWLVEDSVVGYGKGFDQTNYYNTTQGHPCFGRGDPIVGYSHRRVLRAAPFGAWGASSVIPPTPETGRIYRTTLADIPVSPRWDERILDVVAFVSSYNADPKLRPVLNSDIAPMLSGANGVGDQASDGTADYTPWPLPATDVITLPMPPLRRDARRLLVSDVMGRALFDGDPVHSSVTLDVASWKNGAYFYRLIDGDREILQGRFFVMH